MSFSGDLYPTAGATSVMTTKGDMVDYDTARQRLGIGSANQILQVKSNLPSWETVPLADTVLTTAGDVLYENNTPELARLPKASDGDVLTLSSGLPSWSAPAGGGGKLELIDSQKLTGTSSSISSSFTAVPQADVSKFVIIFSTDKSVANSSILVKVGSAGSLLTTNYDQWIIKQKQVSTMGNWTQTGASSWEAFTNLEGDSVTMFCELVCNDVSDYFQIKCMGQSETSQFYQTGWNTTASQTALSDVEFSTNAGSFGIDTKLSVYKVVL